jgi:hypothetical protein
MDRLSDPHSRMQRNHYEKGAVTRENGLRVDDGINIPEHVNLKTGLTSTLFSITTAPATESL